MNTKADTDVQVSFFLALLVIAQPAESAANND
jgi:hypothetical protein